MTNRVRETYRRHQLIAAGDQHGAQGVVWNHNGRLYECNGSSRKEVLQRLRDFVDGSLKEVASARAGWPEATQYLEAFQKIVDDLPESYCAMLKAHYHAPDQTITATELAQAAGYSNYSGANLHYGTLAKQLFDVLPVEIEQRYPDGTPIYTFILATDAETEDSDGHWRWKLRPEVAYALEALGLTA